MRQPGAGTAEGGVGCNRYQKDIMGMWLVNRLRAELCPDNPWAAIRELEYNIGKTYDKLCIVGGGEKNAFLNRLTEETTGKQVVALPIESTAIET